MTNFKILLGSRIMIQILADSSNKISVFLGLVVVVLLSGCARRPERLTAPPADTTTAPWSYPALPAPVDVAHDAKNA
jgi:hypothetical protein